MERQPNSTQNGQKEFTYEIHEVDAYRDGKKIYGLMYIPKANQAKFPTVIYSHGFGGSHQLGDFYARILAQHGFVVYCFDFCGGSQHSLSDGSTLDMSLLTEKQDLEAVINMVRKQPYVDADRLFLLGASMGGAVSAITAAAHPDEIHGLILLYPAFVLVDDAMRMFPDKESIPNTYINLFMPVGRRFAADVWNYDIYKQIRPYDKDVLIIHGDQDKLVPLAYSKKAVSVYPHAKLDVLPGAGHGFSGKPEMQAAQLILEYLQNHLHS